LLQHGAIGFFDLDVRTGRASYSPTWKRMLGYGDDSVPDTIEAWRGLVHPDDSAAAPDQLGKRINGGQRPFDVEFRMRHQDGRWLWIQCVGVQFLSSSGDVERVVGLNLDISERKEVEEDSLINDERLELLSTGSLGVFDLDFSHDTYWFSPGWGALLGYRENEISHELDTFLGSLGSEEQAGGVDSWIRSRSGDRATFALRECLSGKDGQPVSVHMSVHQVLTRRRELSRVVGFISPDSGESIVSGRPASLVEQALAALAEGVIVTDATGRITSINPAACRLLRIKSDDALGSPAADVFRLVQRETGLPADDPITRALSETDPLPQLTDSALPAESANDSPRPIIWTARTCRDAGGNPEGVVILFRDPAEISLTPDELLKANRLESLGIVAGGIAHDFNDLLTTILGGISLAKEQNASAVLEESEKACLSAKELTKQLLTFAKGGSIAHSVMSAEEILNAAVKLASAGSDAAINVEIAEGTKPVRVDRLQLTQVFQNLIINALQAMPAPPHRPQVQLRAANTSLTEDQIPPLPAGDYVEFEVRDNAIGILPENLEQIFDPFFTTRKHGTGLGLATALSIVRKHGGQIGVGSTPGEGTVFTVFVPCADAPALPPAQTAPSLRFRTGRILFMDDDPRITALTATMLESLEYKFDVARDGSEAIQLYQRYFNVGRPYDAVILDITVVGGMGGEECFKHLRDCDPEIRAIISTGYDHDATGHNFIDQGFCGYLTKPYRIAELGKVLKAVLG
jgi:PAS domain S-box-containing protein